MCTALLEPLVSGGELARFIYLSGLAQKIAIVCIVTSSATWGLGTGQGQRKLLRWTVNLRAVDLNLFCLLTMQELRDHPDI